MTFRTRLHASTMSRDDPGYSRLLARRYRRDSFFSKKGTLFFWGGGLKKPGKKYYVCHSICNADFKVGQSPLSSKYFSKVVVWKSFFRPSEVDKKVSLSEFTISRLRWKITTFSWLMLSVYYWGIQSIVSIVKYSRTRIHFPFSCVQLPCPYIPIPSGPHHVCR